MRLSVFSPHSSAQLLIDLHKLYQGYFDAQQLTDDALNSLINTPNKLFFVTLFNARHLGALQVTIEQDVAQLALLCVRDITRRRGVGKNLLREVEKQLKEKGVTQVQLTLAEISEAEQAGLSCFMLACDYQLSAGKFTKQLQQ